MYTSSGYEQSLLEHFGMRHDLIANSFEGGDDMKYSVHRSSAFGDSWQALGVDTSSTPDGDLVEIEEDLDVHDEDHRFW